MIPTIQKQFTDGNLERASGSNNFSRRILIFGTAEDGPMYTPVPVSDINAAIAYFGNVGKGSLVKACNEALAAQVTSGTIPQIVAVRIGAAYANKAYLDIEDGSSNKVLTLEALYAGDVYNDISVVQDGNSTVRIYNPKTQVISEFTYSSDPTNTLADWHNVSELADAINADPNLNDILSASAPEKNLVYELNIASTDAAVESSSEKSTVIDLSAVVTADMVSGNRYVDGGSNPADETDLDKTITALSSVYSVGESGVIEAESQGVTSINLDRLPLDGKADARFNTILGISLDSGTLEQLADNISAAIGGEAYLRYNNANLGKVVTGVDAFTIDAPWGIANDAAIALLTNAAGAESPAGTIYTANEPFKLEYRMAGAGANDWQPLDLSGGPGVDFDLSWAADVLTITITGKAADLHSADGADVRVSFDSAIGSMVEKTTLTAVNASSNFYDYFVRGTEVLFGAPLPANLVFRHAVLQKYELGSTLEIVDAYTPKIKLLGKGIQPGAAGAAISTDDVILGFNYTIAYDTFTISSEVLSGGTNASELSNEQLYNELKEAYKQVDDQEFDIVVAPGAYLDSTKTGYNSISGLPQEVNAEFHLLMKDFLDAYRGAALGVIAFKPLVGSGINKSVTRVDVANRVEKLTEQDLSDPLRAANFLAPFESISMVAVDVEPIFLSGGAPYTSTGEAWIAGYLATLASNQSVYLSNIPGAIDLRYSYSEKLTDGNSQLDVLSDNRIWAATKNAKGIKMTDGPTTATPGSDYERLTTYWIAAEAMNITQAIASDYLGRASNLEVLQALETRLRADLNTMVPGKLSAFSFKIKSSPQQRVLGKLEIVLILIPVFEIRSITVPVILKADESQLASI